MIRSWHTILLDVHFRSGWFGFAGQLEQFGAESLVAGSFDRAEHFLFQGLAVLLDRRRSRRLGHVVVFVRGGATRRSGVVSCG